MYSDQSLGLVLFGLTFSVSLVLAFSLRKSKPCMLAITGGDEKIWFSNVLFLISVQCFWKMPLILFIILSSEYFVTKTNLSGCLVFTVLPRVPLLLLNSMSLMWLTTWFCLYPLC